MKAEKLKKGTGFVFISDPKAQKLPEGTGFVFISDSKAQKPPKGTSSELVTEEQSKPITLESMMEKDSHYYVPKSPSALFQMMGMSGPRGDASSLVKQVTGPRAQDMAKGVADAVLPSFTSLVGKKLPAVSPMINNEKVAKAWQAARDYIPESMTGKMGDIPTKVPFQPIPEGTKFPLRVPDVSYMDKFRQVEFPPNVEMWAEPTKRGYPAPPFSPANRVLPAKKPQVFNAKRPDDRLTDLASEAVRKPQSLTETTPKLGGEAIRPKQGFQMTAEDMLRPKRAAEEGYKATTAATTALGGIISVRMPDGSIMQVGKEVPDDSIMQVPDGKEVPKKQNGGERNYDLKDIPSAIKDNALDDAKELALGLYESAKHPVDTYNSIVDLIFGAAGKAAEALGIPIGREDVVPKFDEAIEALKDSYGGYEEIKRSIAEHPVRTLADISSLLTGTGAALGRTSSIGVKLSKAGSAIDPIGLATKVVSKPVSYVAKGSAKTLYRSAVKLSDKLGLEGIDEAVNVGLDKGIAVSRRGYKKAVKLIRGIEASVYRKIRKASKAGDKVKVDDLIDYIDRVSSEFGKQFTSKDDLAKIEKLKKNVKSEFGTVDYPATHLGTKRIKPEVTPLKALLAKKATYNIRKKFYDKPSSAAPSPVKMEVEAALAHGVMKELGRMYPELKPQLKVEGKLIDLKKAIEKQIEASDSKSILNWRSGVIGQAAAQITGSSTVVAILLATKAALDSPVVKSNLALALHKIGKGATPSIAGLAKGAYVGSRANEAQEKNKALTKMLAGGR